MTREISFWPAIVMAASLLLAGSAGAAGLYKWTDAQGDVHYTQDPPPQGQYQQLTAPPPPPAAAPDDALQKARDALTPPPPPTGDAKQDKLQAEVDQRNCDVAKHNLDTFTTHRRVQNEKGEIVILGDDERKAKIKEAQDQITKYCKQ